MYFYYNSFYVLVLFIVFSRFQSAFSKTNNSDIITDSSSQRYRTPLMRISTLKNPIIDNNINDNEIIEEDEQSKFDTTAPLHGIYTDCILEFSFSCVQRKILLFIDRVSRMKDFKLLGNTFSVVRTKKESNPILNESDLINRMRNSKAATSLSSLIESSMEKFVQNHVLRINLPSGMSAAVASTARDNTVLSSTSGNIIDINISRTLDETSNARGLKDKKLKKFFGMMFTGLLGKLAFLGPFMVVLIKLKAIKALILSKIALVLSLMHMFKGKKGGGGSHGKEVIIVHDAHGASVGGHEGYSSSGWGTGTGGWVSGGNVDSYSSGVHTGGGDSTYSGGDSYAGGHGGWAGGGGATHGWGRRSSSSDPQWVAYRAFIPNAEEEDKK